MKEENVLSGRDMRYKVDDGEWIYLPANETAVVAAEIGTIIYTSYGFPGYWDLKFHR
jgi:hypothetical protein